MPKKILLALKYSLLKYYINGKFNVWSEYPKNTLTENSTYPTYSRKMLKYISLFTKLGG